MAKSSNFFGLRKGSTKSLTFQVLNGEQITKDRVTSVKNPQTQSQMDQRLKLSITATARAVLKTLVNHSFEDKKYGEESLKEFSSINLKGGSGISVAEFVPKGYSDPGLANYHISRGTLAKQTIDVPNSTQQNGDIYTVSSYPASVTVSAMGTANNPTLKAYAKGAAIDDDLRQVLATFLGLDDNEQLTFLAVRKGDEYQPYTDQLALKYHYHRFIISRWINNIDKLADWKIAEEVTAGATQVTITDGFINLRFDTTGDAGQYYNVSLANENYVMQGLCVIYSAQSGSTWKRSSQRLVVWATEADMNIANYDNTVASYYDTKPTSEKYLNTGTDSVDITGGNA